MAPNAPRTTFALTGLTRGERTGSRIFQWAWTTSFCKAAMDVTISPLTTRYMPSSSVRTPKNGCGLVGYARPQPMGQAACLVGLLLDYCLVGGRSLASELHGFETLFRKQRVESFHENAQETLKVSNLGQQNDHT
ncbi:hypothetical protein PoMZ_09816 [Pyricularia oryzae]|nr:hypothetical protein PoMZ_09816 [Pyricularia oryzae]